MNHPCPKIWPGTTLSRRKALLSLALAASGFSMGAQAQTENASPMKDLPGSAAGAGRTSLHYDVEFNVPPQRIYELLLDSNKFAALTGLPAEIDPREGGAFSMFGRLIVGRNVELVPNLRIVQAWRPASWEAGIYSIVRFELQATGPKTRMLLDHTGFAEGLADHLDVGWKGHYLKPMAKLLVA